MTGLPVVTDTGATRVQVIVSPDLTIDVEVDPSVAESFWAAVAVGVAKALMGVDLSIPQQSPRRAPQRPTAPSERTVDIDETEIELDDSGLNLDAPIQDQIGDLLASSLGEGYNVAFSDAEQGGVSVTVSRQGRALHRSTLSQMRYMADGGSVLPFVRHIHAELGKVEDV